MSQADNNEKAPSGRKITGPGRGIPSYEKLNLNRAFIKLPAGRWLRNDICRVVNEDTPARRIAPETSNPGISSAKSDPPIEEWVNYINSEKTFISKAAPAVGRIIWDAEGSGYAGTCFLVGKGLILTSRHVADDFYNVKKGNLLSTCPGMMVDFSNDGTGTNLSSFRVERLLASDHPLDYALLQLKEDAKLPAPLELLSGWDSLNLGKAPHDPDFEPLKVFAIGYPGMPGSKSPVTERQRIRLFPENFGVKMVSPGNLVGMGIADTKEFPYVVLRSTYSVLPGSSGSPVMLHGGSAVIGMHCGGSGDANFAIPAWLILEDIRAKLSGTPAAGLLQSLETGSGSQPPPSPPL